MSKQQNTKIVYLKINDKLRQQLKTEGAIYGMTGAQYARYLCIKHFEKKELEAESA